MGSDVVSSELACHVYDSLMLRRNVPNHFLQLVYKSQIVSLASRQRTLVKMIQDHKGLVTKYMNT